MLKKNDEIGLIKMGIPIFGSVSFCSITGKMP
jgi:hypothetical protein